MLDQNFAKIVELKIFADILSQMITFQKFLNLILGIRHLLIMVSDVKLRALPIKKQRLIIHTQKNSFMMVLIKHTLIVITLQNHYAV